LPLRILLAARLGELPRVANTTAEIRIEKGLDVTPKNTAIFSFTQPKRLRFPFRKKFQPETTPEPGNRKRKEVYAISSCRLATFFCHKVAGWAKR
jgi:hypothetical protein